MARVHPAEAWADNSVVVDNTSGDSAGAGTSVRHTYGAGHVALARPRRQESWIEGCGRRWGDTGASFAQPPCFLEFLKL